MESENLFMFDEEIDRPIHGRKASQWKRFHFPKKTIETNVEEIFCNLTWKCLQTNLLTTIYI